MSRGPWLIAAVALLAGASAGCSPPCETADSNPVTFDGGDHPGSLSYETSPWSGPFLHFPGGRRYRLVHHLGKVPFAVKTYLAFSEHPLNGGNAAESAGNQAVIEAVDDQVIQVRNDQCAEFWLRVVAWADDPGDAGSSADVEPSDAGSDADATTD